MTTIQSTDGLAVAAQLTAVPPVPPQAGSVWASMAALAAAPAADKKLPLPFQISVRQLETRFNCCICKKHPILYLDPHKKAAFDKVDQNGKHGEYLHMSSVHQPSIMPHLPMSQRPHCLSGMSRKDDRLAHPLLGLQRPDAGDTHQE